MLVNMNLDDLTDEAIDDRVADMLRYKNPQQYNRGSIEYMIDFLLHFMTLTRLRENSVGNLTLTTKTEEELKVLDSAVGNLRAMGHDIEFIPAKRGWLSKPARITYYT